MIRKWLAKHSRELHPKPKFLVTAEAYLYATFGPKISDFFDLCLHWVSLVRDLKYASLMKMSKSYVLVNVSLKHSGGFWLKSCYLSILPYLKIA